MGTRKKKLLVIGWDAADWKIINPLIDKGEMPTLEKLIDRGVMGNIATLTPPLSPMLWTSIATGKHADKHGILGFIEPVAEGGARPVSGAGRKCNALWNIFHHLGMKTNVVSWWPSHPSEPINGCMVSNFFCKADNKPGQPWVVRKGMVHPKELSKELNKYRVHPTDITENHILPFVPNAAKIDQEKDTKLTAIAKIIAETASVHGAATYLMENTEWDATMVYYDAIDHFCHGFMKLHPPKLDGVPENLYEMYKDVVTSGYKFQDMMLERMLELADEDTNIVLLSDHGFHSDHLRKLRLPKFAAAPAMDHNPYGMVVIAGPDIKKDERIHGATLLDITPTILAMLGIPIGKDMDGKVLMNAFKEQPKLEFIESWDKVEGDFGRHNKDSMIDEAESSEALKQLIELGYVENPGDDKMKAMETAEMEQDYNLSQVYSSSKKTNQAIELLEKLHKKDSEDLRFITNLINCYLTTGDTVKCNEMFVKLEENETENKKFIDVETYRAKILLKKKNYTKAIEIFEAQIKKRPKNTHVLSELGKTYVSIGQFQKAADVYNRLIDLNPHNASAYHGLAICSLRKNDYEVAANYALDSIGLLFHYPQAHYHLGESLMKMEMYEDSINAFETCLTMAPKAYRARRWLIEIYEKLGNKEKLEYHKNIIKEQLEGEILIIAGTNNSGSNLIFKALANAGMDTFDHPEQKIKQKEAIDYSWLDQANGKTIELRPKALLELPLKYDFKVIFIHRDVDDIIKETAEKTNKNLNTYPSKFAQTLKDNIAKGIDWCNREPNVKILMLEHDDILENTRESIDKINEFIGYQIDEYNVQSYIEDNTKK